MISLKIKAAIRNTYVMQILTTIVMIVIIVIGHVDAIRGEIGAAVIQIILFVANFALFVWQSRIRARLRGMQ